MFRLFMYADFAEHNGPIGRGNTVFLDLLNEWVTKITPVTHYFIYVRISTFLKGAHEF